MVTRTNYRYRSYFLAATELALSEREFCLIWGIPMERANHLWNPDLSSDIQLRIVRLPAVKHHRPLAANVVWLLIRWIHYDVRFEYSQTWL